MKKVYSRDGQEVGNFDGEKFHITDGPDWIIGKANNVYEEGDEGGVSYKGTLRNDVIISMMGEVQFTIGEP